MVRGGYAGDRLPRRHRVARDGEQMTDDVVDVCQTSASVVVHKSLDVS